MRMKIAIIGGGSAGVFAASFIDKNKYEVSIYEKTSRLGRKFLVAGHGGLNLSQDTSIENLKDAYRPKGFMDPYLDCFDFNSCKEYFESIGVKTFTGTSGKLFPTDLRPAEVYKSITDTLNDATIFTDSTFEGFENSKPIINGELVEADYYIFALGGSSWAKTGSDGHWASYFNDLGITTESFKPSNCGWVIDWNDEIKNKLAYKPLKNITVKVDNHVVKGEALITDYGIEGGVIYRSTYAVKGRLNYDNKTQIYIDLKPTMSEVDIVKILDQRKKSVKSTLQNIIKLEDEKIVLLMAMTSKEEFSCSNTLANFIKSFPLNISGLAPINEAISTSGGINLLEVDNNLALIKYSNIYCIGEMLDYDTVTGGYLLQSCMSMAYNVANHLNLKNL